MPSWVRYSVAVYVGLLLAGSLMASKQASAWPWKAQQRAAVQAESTPRDSPELELKPPDGDRKPFEPERTDAPQPLSPWERGRALDADLQLG